MSEGLGTVGGEVGVESSTLNSFVGTENLGGEASELSFIHGEDTGWVVILVFSFGAVVVHDGVHEDISIKVVWPSWVWVGDFDGTGESDESEKSSDLH